MFDILQKNVLFLPSFRVKMQVWLVIAFSVHKLFLWYIFFVSTIQHFQSYNTCFDISYMMILQWQFTPLIYAAYSGHLEIVKYLITVGCNMEARDDVMLHFYLLSLIIFRFNTLNQTYRYFFDTVMMNPHTFKLNLWWIPN